MKKITTEQQDHPAPGEGKGKQTLVLFLFGGLVLFMPQLFSTSPPPASLYAVGQPAGKTPWQVYRLDGTDGAGTKRAAALLRAEAASWLLVNDEQTRDTIFPPALALFFRRPMPVNSCTPDELTLLPGIGPHLAKAMVAIREKRGAFTAPEDLLLVPGIGPAHLQRLRPLVSFR